MICEQVTDKNCKITQISINVGSNIMFCIPMLNCTFAVAISKEHGISFQSFVPILEKRISVYFKP